MSIDDPDGDVKIPILNACLSYIKFLMMNKDKSHIQESVCAKFNFGVIKSAYEALYRHTYPDKNFPYRGPNKASMREKSIHALNEIYKLLQSLDSQDKMPNIACPSDELSVLLPCNGQADLLAFSIRLQTVESEITRLKNVEKTVLELKSSVPNLPKKNIPGLVKSNNVPSVRERSRLLSLQSNTSRASHPSPKRARSDSESESIISVSDDEISSFQVPKYNAKKALQREKKQKVSSDLNSYSNIVKSSAKKPTGNRRPAAVWGKAENPSASSLKGAVPEIFMFNCSPEMDEAIVSSTLQSLDINVRNVKRMSHAQSARRSFKISLKNYNDYDL